MSIATMSTAITMTPTRLRITQRGRRVLAAVIALPLAAALSFSVLAAGDAQANRTASDVSFATVTVSPGDTLWSIAERVAPTTDPRDTIDAIVRLNALDSSVLSAGDVLAIPADGR